MSSVKSALRFADSVLRAVVLLLFGLFLLTALPRFVRLAYLRIEGVLFQAPAPGEVRRLVLGPDVAAAYDRIREAIPRDGEYVLIEGVDPREGSIFWVRYELAPRKALFLGSWEQLPASDEVRRLWPPGARYAVVSSSQGYAPALLEQRELLADLDRFHARP